MQLTAMGYFVVKLAAKPELGPLYLGLVGAARAIPVIICSPIAGVVADTWPRRRVLFATNTAIALLALVLAVFTSLGRMNLWGLLAVSAFSSAAMSFDSPARQSWVPLLVDRRYVGNAIGLNSVAFNAPAVIGPAIAGFLIARVSVSGSFYVNAVATMAVVVALLLMRASPPPASRREPLLRSIGGGIRFLYSHPILNWVILFFIASALLVRPYSSLLPAYALNDLHTNAQGFGWALAATGIGGFGGALITAAFASREPRSLIWFGSGLLMSVGVVTLGFISSLVYAIPILFLIGVCVLTFLGMSNTLIQILSPDNVRGRAISVYTMIALGIVPGGTLIVGSLGSLIGLHLAFITVGSLCVLILLALYLFKPIIRTV